VPPFSVATEIIDLWPKNAYACIDACLLRPRLYAATLRWCVYAYLGAQYWKKGYAWYGAVFGKAVSPVIGRRGKGIATITGQPWGFSWQ
jgi:hypothetical protein